MATKIDYVLDSVNEIHNKMVLAELKVAEEAHYNAYAGEEQAVFWLQGMAGTGKSNVSRTVARWLNNEGFLGGGFFFKKGGADHEDARRLFITLTKEIMERLTHLQQPVKKAIRDSRDIGSSNTKEQTPLILVAVIDGLDKCQAPVDVAAFLSTLSKLNDLKDVQLRVFITSRPEPPVIKGFRPIDKDVIILHQVTRSTIERDILISLWKRLNGIRGDYKLPQDWPGDENLKYLVNMAVPLFIYAATV
ncbi:hypothetical protein AbraIFM66950_008283 [Aspergillus brasiliensis]|nr:hypothetical protein AbraIFM66950_008283 [Aspergillus brasiliensis]